MSNEYNPFSPSNHSINTSINIDTNTDKTFKHRSKVMNDNNNNSTYTDSLNEVNSYLFNTSSCNDRYYIKHVEKANNNTKTTDMIIEESDILIETPGTKSNAMINKSNAMINKSNRKRKRLLNGESSYNGLNNMSNSPTHNKDKKLVECIESELYFCIPEDECNVRIFIEKGKIYFKCTCPLGINDFDCEHIEMVIAKINESSNTQKMYTKKYKEMIPKMNSMNIK